MTDRPNILFITDDQHRWDFFGDTGAVETLRTPNLDRLRSEGATLTNCYSVCPICMPTRFSWCYGLYPSQAAQRLMRNAHDWPAPGALRSMPGALQKQGYFTAMIGKVHSHAGLYANDITAYEWQTRERGFDVAQEVCGKSLAFWFDCRWTHYLKGRELLDRYRQDLVYRNRQLGGEERYEHSFLETEDTMDAYIGRMAKEWLEDYGGEKPFFLHASFCGPHFPLDPPKEYFQHYRPEDMPVPPGVDNAHEIRRWQEYRALYCGLIELVDSQIGVLLETLEKRGWMENTVIIFCTDHGDMIGELGLNHKSLWHDPSSRTPLTVVYPGVVQKGKISNIMAESVDLPATILEIAGCGSEPGRYLPQTPGLSFWGCLTGRSASHRQWAYSECGVGKDQWRMACDRDWKYVWHASRGEMLFHRAADPHDSHNVAQTDGNREKLNIMRRNLIESLAACVAPNTVPMNGEL